MTPKPLISLDRVGLWALAAWTAIPLALMALSWAKRAL